MIPATHDYDPDDNFAAHGGDADDDEGAVTTEALTWQLLLLINPDDDESALQQFQAWQDAYASSGDDDEAHALASLRQAIDWKAGFHVEAADAAGFVECIDELASRWNLRVDWGVEDPTDATFLDQADVPTLIGLAHERLREHGYSLWTWNAHGAAREEVYAGFITLRSDDEALEIVAPALGMDLRPGSAF